MEGGSRQVWPRVRVWLSRKQSWAFLGVGAVAIGFIIVWQVESRHHVATKQELTQTIQAKELVEAELSAEQQRAQALTEALEIKTNEVERVVARLEEEAQTVERLQGRLAQMESQMNQLQAELVLAVRVREELAQQLPGRRKPQGVKLEKVTVSVSRPGSIEGKILHINADWQFVVVDLGWDLLSVGDVLGVYRDEELVAKIQIERVQEQVAAARVLPKYEPDEIARDDRVAEL